METLERLRQRLAEGEFEFSRHAFRRAVERNISEDDVRQAGARAELIESYPDDKYSPSCLLLGFTRSHRPLHMQVAFSEASPVRIVTLYEPDASEWSDGYSRRRT